MRAGRALLAGDTDHAEQLASAALQFGTESGEPDAMLMFEASLIEASGQRGTLGDLVPTIEEAVAGSDLPAYAATLALSYTEAGRDDDAARLLHQFAASGFELPQDPIWIGGMTNYAAAAAACGDARSAGALFELLAPYADQWAYGGPSDSGPVSHHLGALATVLGHYEEADAYFTAAAAFSERMGAKFSAAFTDLAWGVMLAERNVAGDRERAHDLLTDARTAAATYGYAAVERRAAEALQNLR